MSIFIILGIALINDGTKFKPDSNTRTLKVAESQPVDSPSDMIPIQENEFEEKKLQISKRKLEAVIAEVPTAWIASELSSSPMMIEPILPDGHDEMVLGQPSSSKINPPLEIHVE
ncbi:hypothetical protein G9A89_010639 [Geosiphon pyriformis]|nr:hypothetical protein G9A89_010639 [Geosiphon pyriformis]